MLYRNTLQVWAVNISAGLGAIGIVSNILVLLTLKEMKQNSAAITLLRFLAITDTMLCAQVVIAFSTEAVTGRTLYDILPYTVFCKVYAYFEWSSVFIFKVPELTVSDDLYVLRFCFV